MTGETEKQLAALGFVQTKGQDIGMYKTYEWTNDTICFGLYFDRGYFDCYIMPLSAPKQAFPFILLLRYINNDPLLYADTLAKADLWHTLPSADYFELCFRHYAQILSFFATFSPEKYDDFLVFIRQGEVDE